MVSGAGSPITGPPRWISKSARPRRTVPSGCRASSPSTPVKPSGRVNDAADQPSDPASTRLDAEARRLPDLVRASPHYYNTEAEVDRLIEFCASL